MISDIRFEALENTAPTSATVGENQLSADIYNDGLASNEVIFKFYNAGPVASTIASIYFDDSVASLIDFSTFSQHSKLEAATSTGDIAFQLDANPPNIPSGPSGGFTITSAYTPQNQPPHKGVQAGEWVAFLFEFNLGKSFSDLESLVNSDSFRLASHLISIAPNGDSIKYVSNPPTGEETPVPEPTSIMLLALGAVGLGGYARRRNRKQQSAAP